MHRFSTLLARRGGPLSIDGVMALLVLVACEIELALRDQIDGEAWVNAVAIAGVATALAWRRIHPLFVAPVMLGFLIWHEALGGDVLENSVIVLIAVPLATYAMGSCLDRPRALAGFGASLVLMWVLVTISMDRSLVDFVTSLVLVGGPFLVGRIVNARVALNRELRAKAARLEREREERAKLAVAEERARISREMHDVVTHNVSVMVVQASAARRMLDHDPDRAREALTSVERTGREALSEMRRMLEMLRGEDEDLELQPQPSIDEIGGLLERARAAGLDVELEVEGDRRRVQSSVDLSCFRIVQEALRNTIEHAGARRAKVRLRYGSDAVEVDVTDDGRGVAAPPDGVNGHGHGLVAMRERVSMLGGSLQTGYRADGGFEVRATLPLEQDRR